MEEYRKCWIIPQSMQDYQSLVETLSETETKILETVEQVRVVEAKLADLTNRPDGEKSKDEVEGQLRDQLTRLKSMEKHLRSSYSNTSELKGHIDDSLSCMDEVAEDILYAVNMKDVKIPTRNWEPFMPGSSKEQAPRRNSCQEEFLQATTKVDENKEKYTNKDKVDEKEDDKKGESGTNEDAPSHMNQ